MTRKSLRLAAMLLALASSVGISGVAAAQSALPDPAIPGSGYQVPQPRSVATNATSAVGDPSIPGDGYRAPTGPAQQAPAVPVTNQFGSYPGRFSQ